MVLLSLNACTDNERSALRFPMICSAVGEAAPLTTSRRRIEVRRWNQWPLAIRSKAMSFSSNAGMSLRGTMLGPSEDVELSGS